MTIRVLAIGDVGNELASIRKFTKKIDIHIINFYKDGAGVFTYADNIETFENYKVVDHVKKINEIKNNYDICITMGTGERIAYLADLNYVAYYVGRDIDAPRFIKNSKEEWFDEPLHKLNFLERWFYKNTFKNAIGHVAYTWVFEHLKKYTNRGVKLDLKPVDPLLFSPNIQPLKNEKRKFTFFSPQRMGRPNGTDLIWKAIPFCKSDFEILQVEWFDVSTNEELKIKEELIRSKPSKVKFIPMIKREDMAKYYKFSDAVLGNMKIGTYKLVELEGVLCKKPVLQWSNPEFKIIIDNKEIESPFLPESNKPEDIAKIIDKLVIDSKFRDELLANEYQFVKKISDPEMIGMWWDLFFERLVQQYPSINKKSSKIRVKFRMLLFLLANRAYFKKFKKLVD